MWVLILRLNVCDTPGSEEGKTIDLCCAVLRHSMLVSWGLLLVPLSNCKDITLCAIDFSTIKKKLALLSVPALLVYWEDNVKLHINMQWTWNTLDKDELMWLDICWRSCPLRSILRNGLRVPHFTTYPVGGRGGQRKDSTYNSVPRSALGNPKKLWGSNDPSELAQVGLDGQALSIWLSYWKWPLVGQPFTAEATSKGSEC